MASRFAQLVGKNIRAGGRSLLGQNTAPGQGQGQAMTMDANGTPQPALGGQQAPAQAGPSMADRPGISNVGDPSYDVPSGLSFTSPEVESPQQDQQSHSLNPFA